MAEHNHSETGRLGDFRTDKRILLLCALALPIGVVSAFVAQFLLWLISFITNVCFLHRFSAAPALPQENHLGWMVILVPVVGAIIIGLMAR
jgi:H+/Cl- antiporter ClcA